METPKWNFDSTLNVYEPSEDSFLLLDTLESEIDFIRERKPSIVLEIGSGSGIIITALAKALQNTAYCIAVDINKHASQMTLETSTINYTKVDVIQGDLLSCFRPVGLIDLLVFNPPYVVTEDEEIEGSLPRAWAGGTKGRIVIDRLLDQLDSLLSPKALFYLVVIKENIPEEIVDILKNKGIYGIQIAFRRIRGEQLSVLKCSRHL